MVRATACILLAALVAGSASAQRYDARTYSEADGLPNSTVHCITQGPDGCMWFASRSGIASYDGHRWTSYGAQDGLPLPAQASVLRDEAGTLWAAGSASVIGVSSFDGERWWALPPLVAAPRMQSVTAFAVLRRDDRAIPLVGTNTGQLHVWSDGEWTTLPVEEDPVAEVVGIACWGDLVLVATTHRLLAFSAADLGHPAAARAVQASDAIESMTDEPVRGLRTERAAGRLWLVGGDWIGQLDARGFRKLARGLSFGFTPESARVVAEPDGTGGLYFGNPSSLLYFHPSSGLEALDRSNGLISEGVTSLALDREGNMWVAGMRGITKIVSRRLASYTSEHGLFGDEVSAILQRRSGEVVLGHPGGLTFLDDPVRTLALADIPLRGRVLELAEEEDGTLWVAANLLGLVEIAPDGALRHHGFPSEFESAVSAVHVDRAGTLWVGASRLYRRVRGAFVPFEGGPGPDQTYIREIRDGPSGTLYVGTYQGEVWRIRDGRARLLDYSGERPDNGVYALLESREGVVWVGTGSGLYRVSGDRLVPARTPTIDRPIYLIVEDLEGRFWFGTDNGVYRWSGAGSSIRHLTARDGLAGAETNRAAGLVDTRDRVWLGMDNGLTVFDRTLEQPRPYPPTVELLDMDCSGQLFPLDRPVALEPDQRSPIFSFRAISFVDEERVRFETWLEGFDDEWAPPVPLPTRQVRYTHLPAGEYRFHIRAVDAEGRESEAAVSEAIVVKQVLWARPWFLAIAVGLGTVMLYGLVSLVTQRRYARRLERDVHLRTAELRASEKAMAAEKERLAVTLASIADGVVAADREGRVVLLNEAAERILDVRESEAIGRPLQEWLPLSMHHFPAGQRSTEELVLGERGGHEHHVEVSGAPIQGPDAERAGAVFAFRDVTEKNRTERELVRTQRLEALGVLAGGIAHDFNNLLTVVLGGLSMLEGHPGLDGKGRALVRDVESAAERSRSLTEQLMTFSRGGAPRRQVMSITDVVHETTSFALRGSNVQARIDLADDLSAVEIDEGQIGQVLNNLLINARQAMPDGGIIHIRGRNLESGPPFLPAGRHVEIEIADEGPGIAARDIEHVFDPYFSTKEAGSGLGLAIAHSIVKKHEGRLTVQSREGEGAVFRIFLPVSRRKPTRRHHERTEPLRGSGRILVMDDDHHVRVTIQGMLASLGFAAVGARDGDEAISLYREAARRGTPFDAALMDLTVPGGVGGQAAIGRLRAVDPDAVAIVISGYSNDPVLANHRAYGFQARLDKPFLLEDLARVLGKVLEKRPSSGSVPDLTRA